MCGLRSLLVLCVMLTPIPSHARSVWTSRGPSTPEHPSVWLPVGRTHAQPHSQEPPNGFRAGHSSSQDAYSRTSLGQAPSRFASGVSSPDPVFSRAHMPNDRPFYHDPNTYRPFHWDTIISLILDRVTNRMYGNNEFELLNHQCAYHTSPVLMDWHLQILTKVWCSGWTRLTGTAIATRMSRSIEFATRDFVRKAMNNGIISEDDARVWLKSSNNYSDVVEA